MDGPQITTALAVASTIGVIFCLCFIVVIWVEGRSWRASMEDKVDTIWNALFSRAAVSAAQHGLGNMHSPLTITDGAREFFPEHLSTQLKAMYQSLPQKPKDSDLALMIERRFKDEIISDVCLPHGVDSLMCLALAVAVAKGGEPVHV